MALTQKALVVPEIGKPLVLVDNWPIPEPGQNQVQIKVSVAGINPHDQKARDYGLFIAKHIPAILTNDVVGTVTKVGEGVKDYVVGDRIVSQGHFTPDWSQTGLQEYALANIGGSIKIPDSISDGEAATLPSNILAPAVAIFDSLPIPAPWASSAKDFDYGKTTLLIVGGGSNCGKFGVQLANYAGIGTIVVVGGNETELKSFGATHVLDRHGGDEAVLNRIRSIVGDDLVYAYDAINPGTGQILTLNALSSHKKGTMARLRRDTVDESKVVGKNAGFEVRDTFGSSYAKPELAKALWDRIPGMLEAGQIKPLKFVTKQGLEAIHVNEVLDAYRDGKPVTKTHIQF